MRKPQPMQPHIPTQIERIAYRICRFAYGHKACTCEESGRRVCTNTETEANAIVRQVLAEPEAFRGEIDQRGARA